MKTTAFPEELFSNDDAPALQTALERWEAPDLDILMNLLDRAEEKPHTTACLLDYIHSRFPTDEIERKRRLRREKQLGLLDWDEEDMAESFRWEAAGRNCRILEYLGQDEEVLIPEEIGGFPVAEIAQGFFLHTGALRRLLVPEGIQTGTILPREARTLFGRPLSVSEIIRLERKHPLPHMEPLPACLPGGGVQPGQFVQFGHYAWEQNGDGQAIDWLVLQREADRALLLSARVLELLPYHHNRSAVLWSDCDLRSWLNDAFLPAAFTREEQARLLPADLSGVPNPVFRTRDGSRSQDRIFVLNPEEWETHKTLLNGVDSRIPWAAQNGGDGTGAVWLRMPGLNTQYAVAADGTSALNYQGRLVNDSAVGVQPALWIQL